MRPGRVLALVSLLAFACGALAGVPLAVKPGLWEVSVAHESKAVATDSAADDPDAKPGDPAPEPPAGSGASPPRQAPRAARHEFYQYCVTQQDLDRARFGGPASRSCTRTLVRGTSTHVEYTFQCGGEEGSTGSGTLRFDAPDAEHLSGVVAVTVSAGERATTTTQRIEGKWLRASCGDVRGRKRIRKSEG